MSHSGLFLIFLIVGSFYYAESIKRSEVAERAKYWLNKKVPYSMNKYTSDPQGKNYRTDCSGYVSMAWRLAKSETTVSLPNFSKRISKDSLKMGDIMLKGGPGTSGANGHVVIFHKWATSNKSHYYGWEQTPPRTTYRKIPYPYFKDTYLPYRYKSISDDGGGGGGGGKCICSSGNALGEYCGKQLSGKCNADWIYGCNKKNAEVSKIYGNCKKGCEVSGDGKSRCKK